jgi:hypothetical protein
MMNGIYGINNLLLYRGLRPLQGFMILYIPGSQGIADVALRY